MKAYVGVTDHEWYQFLAARPSMDEVNFWRPSGDRKFAVLTPGEPFFFKTHYPHNKVVGGGFFNGFVPLRVSEAWEFYGQANGVADLEQMRRRIGHYRKQAISPGEDPVIGCVLVRDTRFFPPDETAEAPPKFASNIVQGKSYDLGAASSASYFEHLLAQLLGRSIEVDLSESWHRAGPVYGDPRLTPQRLGQRAFQAVVLNAYGRRCAITGNKIRPVLQAAHILPLPDGGEHRLDNGLLLRSDVHTMFDRGYLGVDSKHRLMVSPRLRDEFGNGDQFYTRAGQPISVPDRKIDRPNCEFLEWHLGSVFKR